MDIDIMTIDNKSYFTVLYCGDEIVFDSEEAAQLFIEEMEVLEFTLP